MRVKVQHGWRTVRTQLAKGLRTKYNFVNPYHALEGKTLAEKAKIDKPQGKPRSLDELAKASAGTRAR